MDWLIIGALFLVGVITLPLKIVNWHVVPKTTVALVTGLVVLVIMLWPLGENVIRLGSAQIAALAWGLWCLLSCSWSRLPEFSFRTAAVQMAFVLIFIAGSSSLGPETLTWLCIAGGSAIGLNAALAIHQFYWGDPWIKPLRKGPFGTYGNRNWFASASIGSAGFLIYLGLERSPIWWVVLALVIYALWIGKSKAALVSLTLGLGVIVLPWIWHKFPSMRKRLYFNRAGFFLIKEKPLLGHGMRMFRREVYRAQSEINKAEKGQFLVKEKYNNPKPRETHNDYVGFTVDCGLIGLLLFLAPIVFVLVNTIQSLNSVVNLSVLILGYSVLAMLIDGALFYPFRQAGMALPFWIGLAALESLTGASATYIYTVSPLVSTLGIVVLGLPLAKITHDYSMTNYYANKAFGKNSPKDMDKALKLDRHNSMYLSAILPSLMKQDVIAACHCAHRIIEHYDGDTIPWTTWTQYGQARMSIGSIPEAKKAFEIALTSLPWFKPAQNGLAQCEKILSNGGSVTINF